LRIATGVSGSAIILALAAPTSALALWDDKLEIYVQENITYDSNVFRLSDKIDATSVTGDSQRDDWIFSTSAGINLDIPWSLQRFTLHAAIIDNRYQHFKDIDFTGHQVNAAWLWSVTPRVTGTVGYSDEKTLSSFANTQVRQPDVVTTRQLFGDAAWMVTPSWRVHGVANATQTDHSETRDLQDQEAASAEVGLSYVTAQENRVGVAIRGERGRSPDEILLGGQPFDNEYKQSGAGIQTRWVLSGHSRFDGRLDYTRRRYEQRSERDYSGPTFRATYTWTPTGKITVATTAQRDIAPPQDITTTFVLVTGVAVRPDWAITDKVNIRGVLAYAEWDYRGDPALGLDFEHRVKTAGVSVLWRPFTRVSFGAGVAREVRTSTLATGDYKVNQATLEARIGF
jgi:exopolysaccharide biosynthesis operon protein EpsL